MRLFYCELSQYNVWRTCIVWWCYEWYSAYQKSYTYTFLGSSSLVLTFFYQILQHARCLHLVEWSSQVASLVAMMVQWVKAAEIHASSSQFWPLWLLYLCRRQETSSSRCTCSHQKSRLAYQFQWLSRNLPQLPCSALCCSGTSYPLDSRNTIPSLQYSLVLHEKGKNIP